MSEAARLRRATWMARVRRPDEVVRDGDEAFDDDFWARIPLDERAEVAWRLSVEQWALHTPGIEEERRLSRAIARVIRR